MQQNYTPKDIQRFWNKVDKSGGPDACWLWTASYDSSGYGHLRWGGNVHKAHRVAWTITFGEILEGLFVCHKCDNPPCCNPSHLFSGTLQDNTDDREQKNRNNHVRGERHPMHKLTVAQVEEIRHRYIPWKVSCYKLAKEFGVDPKQIWHIVKYIHWA